MSKIKKKVERKEVIPKTKKILEKKEETIEDKLRREGIIKEEEPESEEPEKEKIAGLPELVMRVDKIEGKLEMEQENRNALNERISKLSEDIGDLRRMILDREGDYTKFEADFEKVQMIVKEIEPVKITKQFEKFSEKLEIENAQVEKIDIKSTDVNKRLKIVEEKFSKVKNFENLVNMTEKINKKMSNIEETKNYVDRIGGKVESVFSDVTDKLSQLKKERGTILKLDGITRDLMKDLDRLKFKFDEEGLNKKDLDELKKSIEKDVTGINPEKFRKLENKIEGFDLRVKSVDELEMEKEKIEKLLKRVEFDHKLEELSDESYGELKRANEDKLRTVNSILEFLGKKMTYNKIKEQNRKISELELEITGLPKRQEVKEFLGKINKLEGRQQELEELKGKFEDLTLLSDKVGGIDLNFNKLKRSLDKSLELGDVVEELKLKRGEFETELKKETEKLINSENSMDQIKKRINESFEHIVKLEGDLEELERKKEVPMDIGKLRKSIFEMKELIELTREEKIDKKELEKFESRMEDYLCRNAEIIKKFIWMNYE